MIQPPVYYPFFEVVRDNDRRLVENELVLNQGRYEIDFELLEHQFQAEKVKLMLLCSPHNPVGRVWTRTELVRLSELCLKYHVVLVSDEIHCDFTWPGHPHTSVAALGDDILSQCVICTSPSKTFNIAGLQDSNIYIPNSKLRELFKRQVSAAGYSQINTMAIIACKAAYNHGEEWLENVRSYILDNLNYLRSFLSEYIPNVRLIEPEGTYLCWLDFGELGLSPAELDVLIVNKAKLWLDGGSIFGGCSSQFQRINIACPSTTLEQAMNQLYSAINS